MGKILFAYSTQPEMESILCVTRALQQDSKLDILGISDSPEPLRERFREEIPGVPVLNHSAIDKDVRRFFKREGISLIFTTHDASLLSLLFILAGSKENIPTVFSPHGIVSEARRSKRKIIGTALKNVMISTIGYLNLFIRSRCLLDAIKVWTSRFFSSKYAVPIWSKACVFGPRAKNRFMKEGVPEEKIVITGQPRFDSLVALKHDNPKAKLCSTLGITSDEPLLLLATQPFVEDRKWSKKKRYEFVRLVLSALGSTSGCELVIKIHPRENSMAYQDILKELGAEHTLIISDEVPLYELLCACDCIMTVASTVGLEAMILDKPVIEINVTDNAEGMGYAASGAAIGIDREEELWPAIQRALYDGEVKKRLAEARQSFVYEQTYLQDGQASRRVANVIISMIEESGDNRNEV